MALNFHDTDSVEHAVSIYEKAPIVDIEKPTDKEQFKQELISAFDQADIILQKSALLKNLEYD